MIEDMINRVICGDCLDFMRGIPDNSVDLVLTDPPYGLTDIDWDKPVISEVWWQEIWRIVKEKTLVILFSQNPVAAEWIISQRKYFRYDIVWEKNLAAGFLDAKKRPLRSHELIILFSKKFKGSIYHPQMSKGKSYNRPLQTKVSEQYKKHTKHKSINLKGERYPKTVLKYSNSNHNDIYNPTQKPLDLMKYLVLTYSNPGDLILDPFAGSGTTLVAAKDLDRRFIGIEINQGYVDICNKRLNAVHPKLELK